MNLRYRPFDEFSQQIGTASDEEVAAYLEDGFKAGNYTQVRVGVGELWRRLRERPAAPATAPDDRREALDASIGRIALLRGEGRIGALKEAARLHAGRGGAFIEDALELLAIAAAFGVCRDAAIRAIKTGWNDGLVEARPAAESAPAATPDPAPVEKGDDVMGELVEAARAVLSNLGANGVALTRLKAAIAKAEGGGE